MVKPQPWSPADATIEINAIAKSQRLRIGYTRHARDQMGIRDLAVGDVLFALKRGFVFADAEPSTAPALFKYQIQSRTPNSGNRTVRVVAIPEPESVVIKIVTVMWVDGT
jgi:hypothetical protein